MKSGFNYEHFQRLWFSAGLDWTTWERAVSVESRSHYPKPKKIAGIYLVQIIIVSLAYQ